MTRAEIYRARSDETVAAAKKAQAPFTITVQFQGGLNERQKDAFRKAANRWSRVIVGDLPRVKIDGEVIDDVLILAEGTPIDGAGGVLGQAGPTHLRPATSKRGAFLPAKGQMQFDSADLEQMQEDGSLDDVIAHEMGHVIGIGTIWSRMKLLKGARTKNPTFVGELAMKEYAILRGLDGQPMPVPVEATGGAGTADSHWRETVFRNELMSGFIAGAKNPLSRLTAASLQDLGYVVDLDAGEPYALPNLLSLAENGLLVTSAMGPHAHGTMLPLLPTVLPDDSLT